MPLPVSDLIYRPAIQGRRRLLMSGPAYSAEGSRKGVFGVSPPEKKIGFTASLDAILLNLERTFG